MKTIICISGGILFVIFWCFIGTSFFPFFAWIMKTYPYVLPVTLLSIGLVGLWLHIIIDIPNLPVDIKKKKNLLFLSLIPPVSLFTLGYIFYKKRRYWQVAWFPFIIVCGWSLDWNNVNFMGYGKYNRFDRIKFESGLKNKFGKTVLDNVDPHHMWDYGNYVMIWRRNYGEEEEVSFYSIDEGREIMPFGQTLLTFGEIVNEYGLYGIATNTGVIIVPPKYNHISKEEDCFIANIGEQYSVIDKYGQEKYNKYESISSIYDTHLFRTRRDNKYGFLDRFGIEILPPKHENFEKGMKDDFDNEYVVFKDDNKYIVYKHDSRQYPILQTEYAISQIVNPERFIVYNSDYKYGVIYPSGNNVIPFEYKEIRFDKNRNEFTCTKERRGTDVEGEHYVETIRITYNINGNYVREESYRNY